MLSEHYHQVYSYKGYGKCAKILHIKFSEKMAYANSADPEGAVWSGSTWFVIPLSILK